MQDRRRRSSVLGDLLCDRGCMPAFAYLDPGTGSLIIQLLIGGVLGALLTARLWWMRFKMFVMRVLGKGDKDGGSGQ